MANDPNIANVVALLHCEGADGSTTFVDDSPLHANFTSVNGAVLSTAQAKFGGASLRFPNTTISCARPSAAGSNFAFGTGDFTIEMWVYSSSWAAAYQALFHYNNLWFGVGANGLPIMFVTTNNIMGAVPLSTNVWHHIALSRVSGNSRIFVDGTQAGSTYADAANNYSSSGLIYIGNSAAQQIWPGYIDEVRITKGVGRYTANFTPPTEPFATLTVSAPIIASVTASFPAPLVGFFSAASFFNNVVPQANSSYYDRWRVWVEDIHGNMLTKDLIPKDFTFLRMLSGPCDIGFKIHPNEPSVQMPNGVGAIQFKPFGHLIHVVKELPNGDEKIWGTGIFQPSAVDPDSGEMSVKATGFSSYANKIPWLENWNRTAVDPFEIVARIWSHIQSYPNGNLGVTIYPTSSGTQMLPGFSFQNEDFIQDFFAIFIRAVDRNDCGDYINKLARDIPFDFWEESTWNSTTHKVDKAIRLAYPYGGTTQEGIIFRLGENVSETTQRDETEIDWFSDITINGYFPGKVYSSTISNADPNRLRRVMDEKDLRVDSNERTAAWAHRWLTRRQAPRYFDSIIVEPYHSNAPFGSYDVGDIIRYQGPMHWHGNINQQHKVMMMAWDEKKDTFDLKLKAEGAFNYDPIAYLG